MEQLTEFMGNHPYLVLAFIVVAGLLIWTFVGDAIQGIQTLSPQDATRLINHDEAVLVDVREPSEYEQGHIINALHVPLGTLSSKIGRLEKYRSRPIVTVCASGQRSAQASRTLKSKGFEQVYNLKGGMMAWQNASLPVAKGKPAKV